MKTLLITLFIISSFASNVFASSKSQIDFNTKIENARNEVKRHNNSLEDLYKDEAPSKPQAQDVADFIDHEFKLMKRSEVRR